MNWVSICAALEPEWSPLSKWPRQNEAKQGKSVECRKRQQSKCRKKKKRLRDETRSIDSHPRRPASRLLLVNADLARERVPALGGDGRYMVLVGVGEGDDFHGGGEECLFHCSAYFGSF